MVHIFTNLIVAQIEKVKFVVIYLLKCKFIEIAALFLWSLLPCDQTSGTS